MVPGPRGQATTLRRMIVLGIFSSLVLAVALLYWYGTSAMSQAIQEGGAGRPPDHSAKHADIDVRERAQVGGT